MNRRTSSSFSRPRLHLAAAVLAIATVAACSRTQEPEKSANPAPANTPAAPFAAGDHAGGHGDPHAGMALGKADEKAATGAGELVWDAPKGWQTKPNANAMRKATYGIPKAAGDGDDTELTVTQAGGSVTANIDRWIAQFAPGSSVDKKEKTIGKLKVTVVEIKGNLNGGGMPGMPSSGPKEHYAMLGAIFDDEAHGSTFFKMTGPEKSVTQARPTFDQLIESVKPAS